MRQLPLGPRGRVLLTDRSGGVSTGPYATFNLATHVGDDPAAVEENRRRLGRLTGAAVGATWMGQVHGARVATVGPDGLRTVVETDALVTTASRTPLAVLVADCVPVALADRDGAVVGVAHAGRRGIAAGVVPAVVAEVRAAASGDLVAALGPAVCGRCYEVPADVRERFSADVGTGATTTRWGSPGLDLRAAVRAQLDAAGVQLAHDVATCTVEDPSLFSYRRDGVTGRFALAAWLTG